MDQSNKQRAIDFLELVIAGHIDEAYEKYVDLGGKHHNVYFAAGFLALREAMKKNEAGMPNKQFVVKHAIADGDLVAVHSHLKFKADDPGMIVVHLMRFANGKIVELWDVGQAIPLEQPNADGAF
jgi:predicted SnoaL-like aldol condensation-catalyzing enzyme